MSIAAFFLAVLVSYGTLMSFFINPKAPQDTGEFTLVTRFAVDAEGNRTPVGKTVPKYYRYDVPERVEIKLEIVAENCCGMQSEPLTVKF